MRSRCTPCSVVPEVKCDCWPTRQSIVVGEKTRWSVICGHIREILNEYDLGWCIYCHVYKERKDLWGTERSDWRCRDCHSIMGGKSQDPLVLLKEIAALKAEVAELKAELATLKK